MRMDYQKKSVCQKKTGDCKFEHEIIGEVAAKALIAHAQAQAKKRKESKVKGNDGGKGDGKAQDKGGKCADKDRGNDKGGETRPLPRTVQELSLH